MFDNAAFSFPDITVDEMYFLKETVTGLSESQTRNFNMIYSGKRKKEQDMLLFSILGLLVVPGLQRFITGQIGMGILYFFTIGFCFIGSIVDLINYKKAALKYNKKVAFESYQIAKMGA
ncbi:MAG: TM2 domain-containing protein [Mucilaginibacter sp.]|uniref:TM2 domain-containing protein n=1 Tax=Mucilaginibacter sp. TaxID=1882438 RepID=UPI003263AE58